MTMNTRQYIYMFLLIATGITSCKKKNEIGEDPYKGGKEALGVKFMKALPNPEIGVQGETVEFKISGLKAYDGKFQFYINETEAEVLSLTDSTVQVKIPLQASTGGTSVLLEGQTFFGPSLSISGKAAIDDAFKVVSGSNNTINDFLRLPNGNYFLTGSFTNFDNKASAAAPVNRLALLGNQGDFLNAFLFRKGADGVVNSVNRLSNGAYMISGNFGTYNNRKNLNNIIRLNSDGTLDSTVVTVINLTPEMPQNSLDTVSSFNGGVDGTILKSFLDGDDNLYIVGSFKRYKKVYYDRSTRDNKVTDITVMNQVAKLRPDGSLDSTYNFNPGSKQSYAAGNGAVNNAIMQADTKLILVGDFSTFNGVAVNHIVRLKADGTIDQTFNSGSGADDAISSITYHAMTKKIMIAGLFKNYNGMPANGVAMLNADGSLDPSFQLLSISGGVISYAGQLSDGKIIVSGGFKKYNGVVRQGFMILNPNGSLAEGYNNTGAFQGQILKVTEATSSMGRPAVILTGNISRFDSKPVGNIVRVEIKP
jgi:uncharacterized delta-60 repeat protein